MGVSKNRGTPKWMVYKWKIPFKNGWLSGYPYFRKHPNPQIQNDIYLRRSYLYTSLLDVFYFGKPTSSPQFNPLGNQRFPFVGKRLDEITTLKSAGKLIHPWNLTWNLKITQLKRKIIFQTIIFRFHVKFFPSVIRPSNMSDPHSHGNLTVRTNIKLSPSSLNFINYIIWKQKNTVLSSTASPPLDVFSDPSKTNHISKKTPTYPCSIPQESLNPQMKGIPS